MNIRQLAELGRTEDIARIGKENVSWLELRESMEKAAAGGHLKTMTLLRSWGACKYDWALIAAAAAWRVKAMYLLKSWEDRLDYNLVLINMAAGGHVKAMKLLKKWGADSYDKSLTEAAHGGHLEAMILLRSWGATDYNSALCIAAAAGRVEAIKLLKKWGASEFTRALSYAKVDLVIAYSKINYTDFIGTKKTKDLITVMNSLKKWGAKVNVPLARDRVL